MSLRREIARLCGINSQLSRKLAKATAEERKLIRRQMAENRAAMGRHQRKVGRLARRHRAEDSEESEEAARRERRRREGYW